MPKEFVLAVCTHRGVDPDTAGCIEVAHQMMGNAFITMYVSGDAFLDRNRSVIATKFMREDWAPYLIFLDDDILFRPEDLMKLLTDLKDGYRLIGGCYPVRNGTQLASYGMGESGSIWLDGKVHEITWLATGFMGIDKTLLVDMVNKLELPVLHKTQWCESYPFFVFDWGTNEKGGKMLFSEDWTFCEQARKIGEKTWIDTAIQLGHVGRRIFSVEDVVKATQQRAQEEKERAARQNTGAPSGNRKERRRKKK